MHELAQILGFSSAGTTKVADRLADAGLIERSPSRTDRRVIYATLTERGLDVAATAALALADAPANESLAPLAPSSSKPWSPRSAHSAATRPAVPQIPHIATEVGDSRYRAALSNARALARCSRIRALIHPVQLLTCGLAASSACSS